MTSAEGIAASSNYLASPSGAPRGNCTGATSCSVIGGRIPTALEGQTLVIIMMTRKDPVREIVRAHPNCRKDVNRDNAPVSMKQAVAALSHTVPEVEQMVDQHEAHKVRQQIRDEIFEQIRAIVNE